MLTLGIVTGRRGLIMPGKLLELGSKRDLVSHYVVRLCCFPSCSVYEGLEGKKTAILSIVGFFCRSLYLLRCQLPHLWTAQLSLIPLHSPLETVSHMEKTIFRKRGRGGRVEKI